MDRVYWRKVVTAVLKDSYKELKRPQRVLETFTCEEIVKSLKLDTGLAE